MGASAVVTVRIEPELLAALKARARREKSTVSAQIVKLVRADLGRAREPLPKRARRVTMGMYSDLDVPDTIEEFKELRRSFSRRIKSYTPR